MKKILQCHPGYFPLSFLIVNIIHISLMKPLSMLMILVVDVVVYYYSIMYATAGMLVIYTRFKQISYLHVDTVLDSNKLNVSSLVCGVLSGMGLLLVANFQVHMSV